MAKRIYTPPEGYDPDTASPEQRAIVETLQKASEEFHAASKPPSLAERAERVRELLSIRGYSVDLKSVKEYLGNIGEAGYEGGKTGLLLDSMSKCNTISKSNDMDKIPSCKCICFS